MEQNIKQAVQAERAMQKAALQAAMRGMGHVLKIGRPASEKPFRYALRTDDEENRAIFNGYNIWHGRRMNRHTWGDLDKDSKIIKLIENMKGRGTLLSVGCGDGQVAIAAAASGMRATGIDGSEVAIKKANGFAAKEGVAPMLICGDMFHYDFKEQFGVVEAAGVIQHYSGDKLGEAMDRLMGFVAPGGTLYLFYEKERWTGPKNPNGVDQIIKFELNLPEFLEGHGFKVEYPLSEGVIRKQGRDNVFGNALRKLLRKEDTYALYQSVVAKNE